MTSCYEICPDQVNLNLFCPNSQQVLRYNSWMDILLLREVAAAKPYEASVEDEVQIWKRIATTLFPLFVKERPSIVDVMDRNLRDHTKLLLKHFASENREQLKRSISLA